MDRQRGLWPERHFDHAGRSIATPSIVRRVECSTSVARRRAKRTILAYTMRSSWRDGVIGALDSALGITLTRPLSDRAVEGVWYLKLELVPCRARWRTPKTASSTR